MVRLRGDYVAPRASGASRAGSDKRHLPRHRHAAALGELSPRGLFADAAGMQTRPARMNGRAPRFRSRLIGLGDYWWVVAFFSMWDSKCL